MQARRITLSAITVLAVLLVAPFVMPGQTAQAQDDSEYKPISLGLWTPVQIVNETKGIKGFRFSLIYGKNAALKGIDIGLVNMTTGSVEGVQWGGVGVAGGDFTGVQINVVANVTKGTMTGVQAGFVNVVGHGHGLMLGFVNQAQTMKGLQIGLINIIKQDGFMPFFPIVNWSF